MIWYQSSTEQAAMRKSFTEKAVSNEGFKGCIGFSVLIRGGKVLQVEETERGRTWGILSPY